MTANQFVAALCRAAKLDQFDREGIRPWATVPKHASPRLDHLPDPLMDLLARYDLSAVVVGQFRFTPATVASPDDLWLVAVMPSWEYYYGEGRVLSMHCHADYPRDIGLTTSEFLDVVALYAEFIATLPPVVTREGAPAICAPFAERASAISPHASKLYWFGESLS